MGYENFGYHDSGPWLKKGLVVPFVGEQLSGSGSIWVSCYHGIGASNNLSEQINSVFKKHGMTNIVCIYEGGASRLAFSQKQAEEIKLLDNHLNSGGILVTTNDEVHDMFYGLLSAYKVSFPNNSIKTILSRDELEILETLFR